MPANVLFVGLVIFGTHCVGTLTGFGSTVLALPLLALVAEVSTVVPALVALGCLNCLLVLAMSWRQVDYRLACRVLLGAIPGLPLGFYLFSQLPEHLLRLSLGFLVLSIAAQQLVRTLRNRIVAENASGRATIADRALLLGSGMMHGAFGIGGPLLVIYAARNMPGKDQFRLTLCAIWLVLNSVVLAAFVFSGQLTPKAVGLSLQGVPFLLLAAVAGELFHQRIGARAFRVVTFSLLAISGLALITR